MLCQTSGFQRASFRDSKKHVCHSIGWVCSLWAGFIYFHWSEQKCREVEKNVLRALALAFGLEEDWFLKYHETAGNQLRLARYPRQVLHYVIYSYETE
jgi:hypothetical protein